MREQELAQKRPRSEIADAPFSARVSHISCCAPPLTIRAMSAAYCEKWPGANVSVQDILGSSVGVDDDETASKLQEMMLAIVPAHMAGDSAASRDLAKINKLWNDLLDKIEAAAEKKDAPQPPEAEPTDVYENQAALFRFAHGPQSQTSFQGIYAPYSIVLASDQSLPQWILSDPDFPKSREEIEQRFGFHRGKPAAKKLSNDNKIQIQSHTGLLSGSCNGLDGTQAAPRRLVAFAAAFREIHAAAMDDLHARLREALAKFGDSALGENGKQLRDVHPKHWLFNWCMIQLMKPGDRSDGKHADGGASLVHLGLSLCGNRVVKHWERDGAEHELAQKAGDAYISNPAAYYHQVFHRDGPDNQGLHYIEGMGLCKIAVQFRCAVFAESRGTVPPATPRVPFEAAAIVVQK